MEQKKLGIIFVVNYRFILDNTYLGEAIFKNISDLENGLFNVSNYIVNDAVELYFLYSMHDKTNDTSAPQTFVKKMVKNEATIKYKLEPVLNLGAINLGDKDVLSTALNFLNLTMNAKEYVIVLYNHGNPFGLYEGAANNQSFIANYIRYTNKMNKLYEQYQKVLNNNNNLYSKLKDNSDFLKIIKENQIENLQEAKPESDAEEKDDHISIESYQEPLSGYKPDMLTNAELNKALKSAFPIYKDVDTEVEVKQIKLIVNCGCYAQNIDTLYALYDIADYIIGAPTSVPEITFNFQEIVNPLIEALNNSTIDYPSIITQLIGNYSKNQPLALAPVAKDNLADQRKTIVISAVDCAYVSTLVKAFDELLLEFMAKPEIYFKEIADVKFNIRFFEMTTLKYWEAENKPSSSDLLYQYDLGNFIEEFVKVTKDKNGITNTCRNLIDNILDKMVIAIYKGSSIDTYDPVKKISGISFYFPENLEDVKKDSFFFNTFYSPSSKLESEYAKASYLENFIFLYLKYIKSK
jgi:hypothetical protein